MIYQIYFDKKSRDNCHEQTKRFYNMSKGDDLRYFENDVIIRMIGMGHHLMDEYLGIFSHRFFHKNPFVKYESILETEGYDVVTFFSKHKKENYLSLFDNWHKGGVDILKGVVSEIGQPIEINPKTVVREVVYQNAFYAKSEVWEDYVRNWLVPAREVMESNKWLISKCNVDSGYKKLAGKKNSIKYTMHTFVLERLFSIYLTVNKNITVKQL